MEEADSLDEDSSAIFAGIKPPSRESIKRNGVDPYASELSELQIKLFNEFIPLVEAIAMYELKIWKYGQHELDEAIADGYCGLIKAIIEKYDPEKALDISYTSNSFILFIRKYIKGYILNGMRDRYGRDGNGKISRQKPSVMYKTAQSINSSASGEEDSSILADTIADPRNDERVVDFIAAKLVLAKRIDRMPPKNKRRNTQVVLRSIFLDEPQEEIAEYMGLDQPQVSRIINKTLNPGNYPKPRKKEQN